MTIIFTILKNFQENNRSKLKLHFFLTILIGLITINCPKQPDISELLNQRIKTNFDETVLMNVYFSTLRKDKPLSSRGCSNGYFSTMLGTDLRYGKCNVNTPSEHTIGSLDSAQLGMPNKFFSMKEYSELDSQSLTKVIQDSPEKEVLVFVHGFNVGFEEAIYRAAQIKYDMKFQGEILVYTWPAGGEDESFINQLFMKGIYESNLMNAVNSRAHFKTFLDAIHKTGKKIHLVVHSMGHQVVLPILSNKYLSDQKKFIGELILNAPDYDVQDFKKIVTNVIASSDRVTLYCSPGDNALIASQKVNGNPRVGMCARFDGIDVINVNEVDDPVLGIGGLGHGYYSSRAILTDQYQVLLGIKAEKRLFIRKSGIYNSELFVLRK